MVAQEFLERVVERRELRPLAAVEWERMDQVETETAEEELAHEARLGPLGLAGGLGDFHRLGFGHVNLLAHEVTPFGGGS